MSLWIANIDHKTKTLTLSTKPPKVRTDLTLTAAEWSKWTILTLPNGTKLRRGVMVCADTFDGPLYCPWPQERG